MGYQVTLAQAYRGEPCDLMVALHARRSFPAIEQFRRLYPSRPLIVALTGTDLYSDIKTSAEAQESLEMATRLIVLQSKGTEELPSHLREKTRVIYQSVVGPKRPLAKSETTFDVCVLGHLREVKDPFRTALAARLLPETSRIRVLHVGKALNEDMMATAQAEAKVNPRYHWLGELKRWQARGVLARSHISVLSSQMEGGANVISEALAVPVPVLASRISGSIGLLGQDYPGYFTVGDTQALARLLQRVESDAAFYQTLAEWCRRLAPLVHPDRERESWHCLLQELTACLSSHVKPTNL
jgi:putative glycosyltransferase (TIGR04348 family)